MGCLARRRFAHFMSGPGPSHCVVHASISEVPEEGEARPLLGITPSNPFAHFFALSGDVVRVRCVLSGSAKQASARTRQWQEAKCHAPSLHCMLGVTADSDLDASNFP